MAARQQQKSHKVGNENIQRYLSVKFPLIKKCKISNMNEEILRRHLQRLRHNNNFYLNVSEWLASPGGTKFLETDRSR